MSISVANSVQVGRELAEIRGVDCGDEGDLSPQYSDRGDDMPHVLPKNHRKVYDLMRIPD